MTKEEYIKYTKKNIKGQAQKLVLNQIELYYKDAEIKKNKYKKGEEVFLKKGTFLHGLGGNPKAFDFVVENGFIGNDFNGRTKGNKIFNSIGMWNIQEDMTLKDYISFYSGASVKYYCVRSANAKENYKIIPYGKIEEELIKLNNEKDVWSWQAEQTKEIRFMPSLASDKVQIGFILNMESDYAKELAKADFFNKEYDKNILKYFADKRFLEYHLSHPLNPLTTDRESAIFFGLPPKLIEGVLVGRIYEKDKEKLKEIKEKLPDCYICNLDGKVIVE